MSFRLAGAVLAACLAVSGCSESLSREDFSALVMHKSEQEVRQELGSPSRVEAKLERVEWVYASRTFNPEKGNRFDRRAVVVFRPAAMDGALKVEEVLFQ